MNRDKGGNGAWRVTFEGYNPADEGRREALLALGNGYMMTRAAAPEAVADGVHYPGAYRAGLYNRLESRVAGEVVEDASLVNLPNWLPLTFRIRTGQSDTGRWFALDEVEVLAYRQTLELRRGLLRREVRFRDPQGRRTTLFETRFVSMADPHLAGLKTELVAENWSGEVEVRSALDGRVVNGGVERYAPYSNEHLEPLETGALDSWGVWLKARTKQSRVEIALAARTSVFVDGDASGTVKALERETAWVGERIRCNVNTGARVVIEKLVALYSSSDFPTAECGAAAREAVERAPAFGDASKAHERAWERLWERCDVDMTDEEGRRAVRFHMFHVLQIASPHTADLDVGIPARGLHGEAYRGHVFWDELFVFPFLTFRFPALARALLMYRYRRLGAARRLAKEHGFRGAMFPWRSASSGLEETPRHQLNPLSGRWMRDHTRLQRHIGAAVAYNVLHYAKATGDDEFMCDYGAELLLDIARFWASLVTYDAERDRFDVRAVMGPDEYHSAYPNADAPGIDNNTYTNLMAVWTLLKAFEVLDALPPGRRAELLHKLELDEEELAHWDRVSRRMRVVFEDGVLSQFEGFEGLKSLDVTRFSERHGDERLDWVLEAKGESVNAYRVAKQADTAMLFYLLPEEEIAALLERLGYPADHAVLERTVKHHLERTTHASSLSRVVYAGALARRDPAASWELFREAQFTDLAESESTADGVHLGAMAGTIGVMQSHYLGLGVKGDALRVDPAVPEAMGRLCLEVHYRRCELRLEATSISLEVGSAPTNTGSVNVVCWGRTAEVRPGASVKFDLKRD